MISHKLDSKWRQFDQIFFGGLVGYGWMAGWMDGWLDGWLAGWMDGCVDGAPME